MLYEETSGKYHFHLILLFFYPLQSGKPYIDHSPPTQEISFEQASSLFGGQKILTFRRFSLSLDDNSQQQLAQLVSNIMQYPAIIRDNLLVIQTFTCPLELKIKPYIGAVRGQVIIDYLEKKIGLNRKICLIQESGATADIDCLAGSGANIYLQDGWAQP